MHEEIIQFWFRETEPSQWWTRDTAFDELIGERFGELHRRAARCELFAWRSTPSGRLAEIIVLDQFSRNISRGTPACFAQDPHALALAQEAVRHGADRELPPEQRGFLYMPYMHSESLVIHDFALPLFTSLGNESMLDFERRHRAIIERFGRYPHRNAILGRASTAAELAFLEQPGSSF